MPWHSTGLSQISGINAFRECYWTFSRSAGPDRFTFEDEKGVVKNGVKNIVTCSDDVFDARTISDNAINDVVGAHLPGEEKMAQEGLNGIGYAMSMIMSGHDDVIYLTGTARSPRQSVETRLLTWLMTRSTAGVLGLDYLNVAGLQARAYMEKSNITEEQLARW